MPNTRLIWEAYLSNWDKMATILLKTCFEALRADDCFWIGENCTLRENMKELKIIERNSGNIVVIIVIDDIAKPPNQEIYVHDGSSKTLQSNWNQVWKQLWYKDRPRNRGKGHEEKMQVKELTMPNSLTNTKTPKPLPPSAKSQIQATLSKDKQARLWHQTNRCMIGVRPGTKCGGTSKGFVVSLCDHPMKN